MGYEIDFLPVGEGNRSGDAIALRFGNLLETRPSQTVIVIDGGTQDTGAKLVDHIQHYYKTDVVDLVVSTHPDSDHSSGLSVVMDRLKVQNLAMHQPWNHTQDIADLFKDGRVTDRGVREALQRSLESAKALEELAQQKSIPIVEPFTGSSGWANAVRILGPSRGYYDSLLPHFRGTPEPASPPPSSQTARDLLGGLYSSERESLGIETLDDDGKTSAENNSSVILLLTVDGRHMLFTGDAGIPALTYAANQLDTVSWYNRTALRLVQVPHHGSRRNVGPTILDRLLGPRIMADQNLREAVVSAAPDGAPKHPAKKVTNAFRRRGAWVYSTAGKGLLFHADSPSRGWTNVTPLPLYDEVDE